MKISTKFEVDTTRGVVEPERVGTPFP